MTALGRVGAVFCAASALAVGACLVPTFESGTVSCVRTDTCVYGWRCVNGFCVAPDAGAGVSTGASAGTTGTTTGTTSTSGSASSAATHGSSSSTSSGGSTTSTTHGTASSTSSTSSGTTVSTSSTGSTSAASTTGATTQGSTGSSGTTGSATTGSSTTSGSTTGGAEPDSGCSPTVDTGPCLLDGDAGGYCCGGRCVDVTSDTNNCGGCGDICVEGATCSVYGCSGGGTTCPAGTRTTGNGLCLSETCDGNFGICALNGVSAAYAGMCCAGTCIDPGYNIDNCGGCGLACASSSCTALYAPIGTCYPNCQNGGCATGDVCLSMVGTTSLGCVATVCGANTDGFPCAFGGTQLGTCCGQVCTDAGFPSNCAG